MSRYKVVHGYGRELLEKEINRLIKEGYTPVGGIIVTKLVEIEPHNSLDLSQLAQTMYLPEGRGQENGLE